MKMIKKLTLFILVLVINISVVNAGVSNKLDDLGSFEFDNSDLKYLYVYNCDIEPDINYDLTNYNIVCPMNTKNLKITYRARSRYSTAEVIGNKKIQNGSLIQVKVTANEGQEKVYNFTVRYSNSKLIYTILIIFIIIILILAIAALTLYILYTKDIIKIKKKRSVNVDKESYVK